MKNHKVNLLILNVSVFEGMAPSMRVRNLIDPLIKSKKIDAFNLIYSVNSKFPIGEHNKIADIEFFQLSPNGLTPMRLVQFFFNGFKFIWRIKRSKESKNVLYNYGYLDLKNIFFVLFAKLLGFKVVIDIVEDNRFQNWHSGFLGWLRLKSSLLFLKSLRQIANCVVVISDNLYSVFQEHAKKDQLYLIPITVNMSFFPNTVSHNNLSNEVRLFYGGSFGSKDGVEYLFQAFERLAPRYTQMKLILSGKPHNSSAEEWLLEQIKISPFSDRINYLGMLDTDKYYEVLNKCDIFCMTRTNSQFANAGFPFKLGEFLATGKGVVATNVGGVGNYLYNNKNCLLISPESTEEIVKAISTLLADENKLYALGAEARKTAVSNFSSDVLSEKLYSILKAL